MAARKSPSKATETEATQDSPVITSEKGEDSPVITSEAEAAKAEPKLVSIMNVSPYGKVNPTNSVLYRPNQIVKDVKLDNWVQVQIDAGILKVID